MLGKEQPTKEAVEKAITPAPASSKTHKRALSSTAQATEPPTERSTGYSIPSAVIAPTFAYMVVQTIEEVGPEKVIQEEVHGLFSALEDANSRPMNS